jgi:hypothetical protein
MLWFWRTFEPTASGWTRFLVYFATSFLGLLGGAAALIIFVDPYDSGRFPALPISGISDDYQRTANVSLGRSANFNAAIFGNSHGQLIDPYRLSKLTGLSFVQMATPGVNAPEEIAMMRWFVRHHHQIGAIVLATDDRWCPSELRPWNNFPFWLYGDSDFDYLRNVLSSRSVAAAYRRLRFALGWVPASDPRGYDNYELKVPANFHYEMPPFHYEPPASEEAIRQIRARNFPGPDELANLLSNVDPSASIIVFFAPRFYTSVPVGGISAFQLDECKSRMRHVVQSRPRGAFLDYFVDTPMARDRQNFWDEEHYRSNVAREIESAIAQAIEDPGAHRDLSN